MANLGQDLVFGIRMLLARPGFTLAAVLSLALGIGANTTIFSLINSSLLADLPYREANRLVAVWTSFLDRPAARSGVTAANYLAWKEQARSFAAMGGAFGFPSNIGTAEDGAPAERIDGWRFTASMWDVLSVSPILGRVFTPDEDRDGSPAAVVVLSYDFWQRRFAGDPEIVGKTVRLDGVETDIIGVMPPGFDFRSTATDIFAPAGFTPQSFVPGPWSVSWSEVRWSNGRRVFISRDVRLGGRVSRGAMQFEACRAAAAVKAGGGSGDRARLRPRACASAWPTRASSGRKRPSECFPACRELRGARYPTPVSGRERRPTSDAGRQ